MAQSVVIVEWESMRHGSMRAVFTDAEQALELESRINAKWGEGSATLTREPVNADPQTVNID